jgi:hypothetical protein
MNRAPGVFIPPRPVEAIFVQRDSIFTQEIGVIAVLIINPSRFLINPLRNPDAKRARVFRSWSKNLIKRKLPPFECEQLFSDHPLADYKTCCRTDRITRGRDALFIAINLNRLILFRKSINIGLLKIRPFDSGWKSHKN